MSHQLSFFLEQTISISSDSKIWEYTGSIKSEKEIMTYSINAKITYFFST